MIKKQEILDLIKKEILALQHFPPSHIEKSLEEYEAFVEKNCPDDVNLSDVIISAVCFREAKK